MTWSPTADQFAGCLLGKAVGDAIGAPYEGLLPDLIYRMGPATRIVEHASGELLCYTDDTQMAIGVAETLIDCGRIEPERLRLAFVENYEPDRGYGQGARRILAMMARGRHWRELAETIFPGGSFGNGAAMRVAPVGLLFFGDLDRVALEAERSARLTHVHPLGIDGARALAIAVALALRPGTLDRAAFYREMVDRVETEEFQWQLETSAAMDPLDALTGFGSQIEAHRSVTSAINCFTYSPDDFREAVRQAIGMGDDTDTMAAMTGALCGARLGLQGVPRNLIEALEESRKGQTYIRNLAQQLFQRTPAEAFPPEQS